MRGNVTEAKSSVMWILAFVKDHQVIAAYLAGILTALVVSGVPFSIKKGDLEVKVNMLSGENLDLRFQTAALARVIECGNGKVCE